MKYVARGLPVARVNEVIVPVNGSTDEPILSY